MRFHTIFAFIAILICHPADALLLNVGDILVTERLNGFTGAILRVNPNSGNVDTVASGGNLQFPRGMAMAQNGNLLITDVGSTSQGGVDNLISVNPITGSQNIIATFPFGLRGGITIDDSGNVYVVAKTGTGDEDVSVVQVDPVSGMMSTIASDELFWFGESMTTDRSGNIIVALDGPNKLLRVDKDSHLIDEVFGNSGQVIPDIEKPLGIALEGDGSLLFADNGWPALMRLPEGGNTADVVTDASGFSCSDSLPLMCGVYVGIDVGPNGEIATAMQLLDGSNQILLIDPITSQKTFLNVPTDEFDNLWDVVVVSNAVVPLPAALPLFSSALVTLGFLMRRKTTV